MAIWVVLIPDYFDLHSNALAWLTKLGSAQQREGAVAKMLQLLADAKETIAGMEDQLFGIGWTQLILAPIFEQGHVEVGMRYLRRYFKPFIDLEAATWAEDFVPNIYNTAHGWGACVNSLIIESICGIQPLQPGWNKLRIQTHMPHDLDVSYCFQTPVGKVQFKSEANRRLLLAPPGVAIETHQTTLVSSGEWVEV